MVPDCSGNLILFHQGQVCFLLFFHFALFILLYLQKGAWSKIEFPSRGFGTREGVGLWNERRCRGFGTREGGGALEREKVAELWNERRWRGFGTREGGGALEREKVSGFGTREGGGALEREKVVGFGTREGGGALEREKVCFFLHAGTRVLH